MTGRQAASVISPLTIATLLVSLAAHAAVFVPVAWMPVRGPAAVYDDGTGSDSFRIEQGIAIEGVSQGEAAERVEVAEVAPTLAAPAPVQEVKPVEDDTKSVITAAESPVEVAKAVEEPPPPEPVKPQEVAAIEQPAQVEMFAEKSAGKAQDGGKAKAREQYAGQLNKSLRKVRVGQFRAFGTVTLQFELDRSGKLISRQILTSSGNAALDRQALDWIERAEFPPLPEALGNRELFTVPLQFQKAAG